MTTLDSSTTMRSTTNCNTFCFTSKDGSSSDPRTLAPPSFVLARTDPKDATKVTGITFLVGAQPFEAFKRAIDQALVGE